MTLTARLVLACPNCGYMKHNEWIYFNGCMPPIPTKTCQKCGNVYPLFVFENELEAEQDD